MTSIDTTLNTIEATANRVGLAVLAREAGVPYTTVKSFADRDWSHKSLKIIGMLAEASKRLDAVNDPSQDRAA